MLTPPRPYNKSIKNAVGPVPYPSIASSVLPAVRSPVPEIYGGQVFPPPNLLMVSIREMGGFPIVLPPRVTLLTVAEPPPPKPPMLRRWCAWNQIPPPLHDVTAMSSCHVTATSPYWCHLATSSSVLDPTWWCHDDVMLMSPPKKVGKAKSLLGKPGSRIWGSFW